MLHDQREAPTSVCPAQEKTTGHLSPGPHRISLQKLNDVQVEIHRDRFLRKFPSEESSGSALGESSGGCRLCGH